MGRYCRICGRTRPNEKFSGRGHRNHVCEECTQKPKEEHSSFEQEDEILGFLEQSHISEKNVARIETLTSSENQIIADLANIVLEVARVKSYKKDVSKF